MISNIGITTVKFLNQPFVKEGIKNVAGNITFTFGLIEAYDIYQILRGREISAETSTHEPKWKQAAYKAMICCAKVSLILSAGVSRPGIYIVSTLVGSMFATAQLERVFGPNTIFAVNPWHPRHVISIAAFALAMPSVLHSAYRVILWSYDEGIMSKTWLTDAKVKAMALFNTITSRPVLHWGNQMGRMI